MWASVLNDWCIVNRLIKSYKTKNTDFPPLKCIINLGLLLFGDVSVMPGPKVIKPFSCSTQLGLKFK